ncbi:hypothetical protein JCM8097_004831 [Rhodosporidiobolus ruineniae]
MARREIGNKPQELDMLLSPSRGLQGDEDEVSLRNLEVQERFRRHIDDKLRKWAAAHPPARTVTAEHRRRRDEELGIILLDLRKLREGITSSRRMDTFACEVYEASALLSLFASNTPQLASTLPHLVVDLHPALASSSSKQASVPSDALASSFADLSIGARPADPAVRAFFLTLHLLHLHLLPAFTAAPIPTTPSAGSSSPPLSTFLPTLLSLLEQSKLPAPSTSRKHPDPHIAFLLRLYTALLRSCYISLARLLSSLPPPPSSVIAHLKALHLPTFASTSSAPTFHPLAALLRLSIPSLRSNRIWPILERAYRFPPDKTAWLGKPLLFEFEAELDGVGAEEGGGKGGTGESGEDGVDEGEGEGVREEAERRAEEWVAARKGMKAA